MEASARKTVPEKEYGGESAPTVNLFQLDFILRLLLFATTLTALLVLVTGKQTETVILPIPPFSVTRSAKFNHSPALIYLVTALAVTCFYSILTLVTSGFATSKKSPSTKLLFHLVLLDALMAGILAAATGAGGAVAYIGVKGNKYTNWNKICKVFDKFCRHTGSAVGVSLIASILLVALVLLSTYSLYRRSR
uniref:CASP-like protein n=1 Tax=Anthurium amnicola TaxID=1678845 RepID=A0A1D1ZFH0_9ARAE